MRSKLITLLLCLITATTLHAADRDWLTGTLTATERQKIKEGSTTTSNGNSSHDRNGSDYNNTTTKSDNYENYQVYTIQTSDTVYVASEHLLFPWSKPATIVLGKPVKFAVEKGSMYLMGDDGKQHKATIVSSSLKQ
jgi:hypothetical protein